MFSSPSKNARKAELVGVDIDDSEIRLAVAERGSEGLIMNCYRRSLPEEAVKAGVAVNTGIVNTVLRELTSEAGLRRQRVSLVLGGQHTVCRVEPMTEAEQGNVAANCTARMKRYVTFAGRPVMVDHFRQVNPQEPEQTGWLVAAAALRSVVDSQVAAVTRAGLLVEVVGPAIVYMARMIRMTEDSLKPEFLLVAHGGTCELGLLRQDGLIFCQPLGQWAQPDGDDTARLAHALRDLTDYNERHAHGDGSIETLKCCGTVGDLQPTFEQLGKEGFQSGYFDPLECRRLQSIEGESFATVADRAVMTPAIAAALSQDESGDSFGRINLLPRAKGGKRFNLLAPRVIVPIAASLIALVGMLTGEWLVNRQTGGLIKLLANPTPAMVECSRLQLLGSQLKREKTSIKALLSTLPDHNFADFLDELPRRLPPDSWLVSLELRADGKCVLEGKSNGEDPVFALVESLNRSPYVEAAQVENTRNEEEFGLLLAVFRIEVSLAKDANLLAEAM